MNTEIDLLGTEQTWIKGEKDNIRLFKVNTHDRHWILRNETHTTGFHPLTGENEKITNNSLPTEADIARLICVHPESKCLNVPLSICCLIHHADKIGASDQNLLQMLFYVFKKHQPQTYFAGNPKKSTLRSLMVSLQLYCSCEEQITQISLELSKFSRHPGELAILYNVQCTHCTNQLLETSSAVLCTHTVQLNCSPMWKQLLLPGWT